MNYTEFEEYSFSDLIDKTILIICDDDKFRKKITNKISSKIKFDYVIDLNSMLSAIPTTLSTLKFLNWSQCSEETEHTIIYVVDTIKNIPVHLFSTANIILVCQLEATSYMLSYVRDKFKTASSFETIIESYLTSGNIMVIDNEKYKIGYMKIEKQDMLVADTTETITEVTI
jgi:hypothetical protein